MITLTIDQLMYSHQALYELYRDRKLSMELGWEVSQLLKPIEEKMEQVSLYQGKLEADGMTEESEEFERFKKLTAKIEGDPLPMDLILNGVDKISPRTIALLSPLIVR